MAIRPAPYKQCPEYADYSLSARSGALTVVAADAPVWSMQWTSAALICVIKRIELLLAVTTAYTTAQATNYGLYFARSYTVADTGGTAQTLTADNGKLDTKYPTTALTDLRMCTTGAITAGTRTLNAQPLGLAFMGSTALAATERAEWQFGLTPSRQEIILRRNEGLVINNLTLMSAVGVVLLGVTVEWAEVPSSSVK